MLFGISVIVIGIATGILFDFLRIKKRGNNNDSVRNY